MTDATTMRCDTPSRVGLANTGLGFSQPVPAGAYRWWYVDGFSECGQFGITLIAFIGSVFSPYYFRSRHRGSAQATEHISLNAILYGPRKARWCMTERGSHALRQTRTRLEIGPSALQCTPQGLQVEISERAMPFGQRVEGRVSVHFDQALNECFELDDAGDHWWWPIAPSARIEVQMDRPDLRWNGSAYMDSNFGKRPIETGFSSWNWCRGHAPDGSCHIHYDAQLVGGAEKCLSLSINEIGEMTRIASPSRQQLPRGPIWRVARPARLPPSRHLDVTTLEDTPFYTRSQVRVDDREFMHESLDLVRFCRPWVQQLLPFRMPRLARSG